MKKLLLLLNVTALFVLTVFVTSCSSLNQTDKHQPNVLLISIDGLRPDIVMNAQKYGLKIPTIKRMMKEGTYAPNGGEGVMPTLTYPSHTSMLTGTNPATHGVDSNKPFDPTGEYKGAWYWFASTKVPTLWTSANEHGYITVNVSFPVSTGAKFNYNVPEFWLTGTAFDSNYTNQFGTPKGLVKEIEADIGTYPNSECNLESDKKRVAAAEWLLKNKLKTDLKTSKKPLFMTVYFASYDDALHEHGIYSKDSMQTLEEVDKLVGGLIKKTQTVTGENLIVNIVSDHGFMDITKRININTAFVKEGLIDLSKNGKVEDWKVFSWSADGSCDIRLKNSEDSVTRDKVEKILKELAADKKNGIKQIYSKKEIDEHKCFPKADFVVEAAEGFAFSNTCSGKLITDSGGTKATHGYSPKNPQLHFSYFIMGLGIPKGKTIDNVKLIDVAPTLATLMEIPFPTAEGKSLFLKISI
jgi:predicted AlkP superfamily pyrophosphatase or phosphodiesterase